MILLLGCLSAAEVAAREGRHAVVLSTLETSPGEVPALYLEAARDAVLAAADAGGVVVCAPIPEDSELWSLDPAFYSTCHALADSDRPVFELRWSIDLETGTLDAGERPATTFTLAMALELESNSDRRLTRRERRELPRPERLVLQTVLWFEGASYRSADDGPSFEKASMLYRSLVDNRRVRDWFAELREHDMLLHDRPSGRFAEPVESRFAVPPEPETDPGPPAEVLREWHEERQRIVDAILKGAFDDARQRAEALLAEPDLPDDLARRVAELRAHAAEKVSGDPRPAARKVEPIDVTFTVRSTRPGRSFRTGVAGRLQLTWRGIRFVPDPPSEGGWFISWSGLVSAGEAEGIWDVAHPLELAMSDDERFFLVEVESDGRFGDGQKILEAIAEGRERHAG